MTHEQTPPVNPEEIRPLPNVAHISLSELIAINPDPESALGKAAIRIIDASDPQNYAAFGSAP